MEIQQAQIIHPASQIDDIALTATLPSEMVDAQRQLISWCEDKITVISEEAKELLEAHDRAKKMKWKWMPLYNLHQKALKRLQYYEKIKIALEAGFYIIPNFPIDLFAIRTKKDTLKITHFNGKEQPAQELKEGEGVYKNPFPLLRYTQEKDSEGRTEYKSYPLSWKDIEFPITMAKPQIMDATSRAMALKCFDQIGIMPAKRNEDPVIIGQIFRKVGYQTKITSFMIAWHLDTSMI